MVGIVILNYNSFDLTKACAESIFANTVKYTDYHIYIVDNNSKDGSGKELEDFYRDDNRVTVLFSEKDCGNSEGWNVGARVAVEEKADYVLFLDSDTVLLNDALSVMLDAFGKDEKIRICGPALYDANGNYIQYAGRLYDGVTRLYPMKVIGPLLSFFTRKKRRIYYDTTKDFIYQGLFSGCCMCIESGFLIEHGFLDENVVFYHEEDILGYQLKQSDAVSCICADAQVRHLCGASTVKKGAIGATVFRRFYSWSGALYVLRKYAKTSRFHRKIIELEYRLFWTVLSVLHKEYRIKRKQFKIEIKRANKKERDR